MKNKYKLMLVIIWMILIFIMSSFDGNESANQSNFIVYFISRLFNITDIQMLSFIIRKMAHFTEYLILGILVSYWLFDYKKKVYIDILLCFIYAFCDEVHQLFVPGRSFQIRDIIIDTCGVIVGIFLFYLFEKKLSKKINI